MESWMGVWLKFMRVFGFFHRIYSVSGWISFHICPALWPNAFLGWRWCGCDGDRHIHMRLSCQVEEWEFPTPVAPFSRSSHASSRLTQCLFFRWCVRVCVCLCVNSVFTAKKKRWVFVCDVRRVVSTADVTWHFDTWKSISCLEESIGFLWSLWQENQENAIGLKVMRVSTGLGFCQTNICE